MSLLAIHDFELALVAPTLAMTERGVLIDEKKRQAMLADLKAWRDPLVEEAREIVLPLLQAAKRLPRESLFRERWTCPCCRNGVAKRAACWSCAGFERKPGKRALTEYIDKLEATGMRWEFAPEGGLPPCTKCAGDGQRTTWAFKPSSPDQLKIVLYNVLKLPKRFKDKKLTTNEEALKSLLALDASGLIAKLLQIAKAATMSEILVRISPADDGMIRSWYNVAGTETGRLSSSETFLLRSTNLQNMPKREAALDARLNVRCCLVPDEGCALVEADLSGAEAWVAAACAADTVMLDRLRAGVDIHKWAAAAIYGKPEADITWVERQLGKMANHALGYGMQWATFQRNVNSQADKTGVSISKFEAQDAHGAYHALRPRLEDWWRGVATRLQATKSLVTCFGRKRTFFGREAYKWLSETHREAIAYEPQSTIADLLNRGMLRWWERYDGKLGELRMQVHDSVVLCVPKARVTLACDALRRCLTEEITVNGISLVIPVDVSTSEASWAEMEAV